MKTATMACSRSMSVRGLNGLVSVDSRAHIDDGFDDGDDRVDDGHEAGGDGVHDIVELAGLLARAPEEGVCLRV